MLPGLAGLVGGARAIGPVVVTRESNTGDLATTSNPHSFGTLSIGSAATDRIVAVLFSMECETAANQQPLSCTIGGISTTALSLAGNTTDSLHTRIFYANVPTGTTAEIVVTFQGATAKNVYVTNYSVTGGAYSSGGTDTSSDMDATDPLTTGSITIPTDGGFIAVAADGSGTSVTWANATEENDTTVTNHRHSTAKSTTAGAVTVTCTGGTNNAKGALSWITFGPA